MQLKYKKLDYGVTAIETWYQREGLACCYLIESNGQVALIDTGTAFTVPFILELLEQYAISTDQVKYIIPTHVHLDHAGGAGQLMALLTRAKLVIHPHGLRHMVDPTKLQAGASAVYGEEKFKQAFDTLLAIDESRIIEMQPDMQLDLNGRKLHLIDTPGHARHHLCVWDALSQGLFTGDVYGNGYPELTNKKAERYLFPVTSPVQLDPPAWYKSIKKLLSYNPSRVYLTHYGVLEQPHVKAKQLHDDLESYVKIALQEKSNTCDRYEQILKNISAYHYKKLDEFGCMLSTTEIEALIGGDLVLCAQGLEFWLQYQERKALSDLHKID